MLKRRAYEKLLSWKVEAPEKALLVDGARQVGKTFLIEQFARQEFADYVKVDFLRDAQAGSISGVQDVRSLVERLSLMVGHEIVSGKTLVFFDEVQEAQNLVTLSKYLVQDGRFRLVMSGSLLGVELRRVRSFPVGSLRIETMYPLDFEEFLWSQGATDSLITRLERHFTSLSPVEESLHDQLLQLFHLYVVVGGMPASVQRYIDSRNDLGAVRDTQRDLIELYRADISRYAGERALQVTSIYDDIPSQLDKENKRFKLRSLRKKATYERYANDFQWLVSARAALKTVNVTEPRSMLRRTEEPNRFKLYLSDTGMLMRRYPVPVSLAVIAGERDVNCGGIYENVVAQELASAGVALRYHRHSGRGEVDFIGEALQGKVLPIEVKSGKTYKRHVALNNLLSVEEFGIEKAFVVSEANVSTELRAGKPVHYIPLYLVPFLARMLVAEDIGAREELGRLGLSERSLVIPPPDLSRLSG